MSKLFDIENLYFDFSLPIANFDCGEHCAPYNELAIPFCCDIQNAIPTAYQHEWEYLQKHTDLWHLYQNSDQLEMQRLNSKTPECQLLLACKGYEYCEREFRALSCRSFPFFPYITRAGEFIGLSYLWEFEDRCWIISHLDVVGMDYLAHSILTYEKIFSMMPEEIERFRGFSTIMRRVFGRMHRAIPVLHRNGSWYKVTPHNGRLRRVHVRLLPKFSYYQIADFLPFPDELP